MGQFKGQAGPLTSNVCFVVHNVIRTPSSLAVT